MEITKVINTKLYKLISEVLQKRDSVFRNNIAKFIQSRHDFIFDIAPYDRIYFNQSDIDDLYQSLGIKENDVIEILKDAYFWNIPINPQCVKEPYVEVIMCCIRYYLKNNKPKYAELASVYLAFSGKFYASIHGAAFPTVPPSKYRSVMDYVINNMLTDKFDIKKYKSLFGAISHLCRTWLNTYGNKLKSDIDDQDMKDLIQQLRSREMSFMMNIAKLYYEAYENKSYLNYETDSENPDDFRLAPNDSATAAKITERTMNYMTSNYVSLDLCNKSKNSSVKPLEIKDIMEAIINNKDNLNKLRRIINILISIFMVNNPGIPVYSIEFVTFSIKNKPNSKNELELEVKKTILSWLDENSDNYRRRKTREATANNYYRSILSYITLCIHKNAK